MLIAVLLSACSTEKNTAISRSYHNLTSKYNIFFNGNESFKKGVEKAEKNIADNYLQILPVFYYSNESVVRYVSSDMDRALSKAAKVISLHSITSKPEMRKGPVTQREKDFYNLKEYNKWIDDNLLLMGKAYVYKREFNMALETFRRLITDFPNEQNRYEAFIWMARAYNEQNEFKESERVLKQVENDAAMPKKYREDLYITFADLFIKQYNYEKAFPWLEKSLNYTRNKKTKTRYSYILAQLYLETEQYEPAAKMFREVIKMNPPYEMTFNARINMVSTFRTGSDEGKSIQLQLKKMLKDEKNTEYLDRIYYALGHLEMKQENIENAIDYFRMSVNTANADYFQKGQAYLTLGDLYYERKDYPMAQAYYDSSLQYMNTDYEKYNELERKTISLGHLVKNLKTCQLEDSLQMLASLTEQQRLTIIDKIIADIVKKEEEDRLQQSREQTDTRHAQMVLSQGLARSASGSEEGKWYFYNLNAKSFGQPEFRMLWGNRRLEDNWRRKNKQSVETFFETAETIGNEDTISGTVTLMSNKTRDFYLQNIPLTDSMMELSHSRLSEALFNLGQIYSNDLNDKNKAIDSYEELLKKYPGGKYTHDSYYYLYELFDQLNEPSKANYYRGRLIDGFPDSPVVKMLTDPDYISQLKIEKQKEYLFYDETFKAFNNNDYQLVINNADKALSSYNDNDLLARFSLLRALAIGGINGREALKDEMMKVQNKFPEHEVALYAKEMTDFIYSSSPELKIADKRASSIELYKADSSTPHFFVYSTQKGINQNQMDFNIINFNIDNFNNLKLSIQHEFLSERILFIIGTFSDWSGASKYLDLFRNDDNILKDIESENNILFLISLDNFNILMKDKDIDKYLMFYETRMPSPNN